MGVYYLNLNSNPYLELPQNPVRMRLRVRVRVEVCYESRVFKHLVVHESYVYPVPSMLRGMSGVSQLDVILTILIDSNRN